jgi:hypothetical protein
MYVSMLLPNLKIFNSKPFRNCRRANVLVMHVVSFARDVCAYVERSTLQTG